MEAGLYMVTRFKSIQFRWILAFGILSIFTFGCRETPSALPQGQKVGFDGQHNLADGCVEHFDPNVDYFPEKASIQEAQGLKIEYFKHYKIVTVQKAWWQSNRPFKYVLVQCGAPSPQIEADQVITIPIQRLVTTSTSYLPALVQLNKLDALKGHAGLDYVHQDEVKKQIQAGKIKEVGANELNYEQLMSLSPNVVMTFAMGSASDQYVKLGQLGLKPVINADYTEQTALGRTEWLKFTAAFFNQEAKADQIFSDIQARYQANLKLVQLVPSKTSAFTGNMYQGTWYIAGRDGFISRMMMDAGASYSFPQSAQNLTLNFESVLQHGGNSQIWIGTSPFGTYQEAIKSDSRYALLKAIRDRQYYFYDGSLFESAVAEPDAVLKDMIAVFHPEILPHHPLNYFKKME